MLAPSTATLAIAPEPGRDRMKSASRRSTLTSGMRSAGRSRSGCVSPSTKSEAATVILSVRYSKRFKAVDEIPVGATIAIPNDPSNEARTLLLLETTGLIKLRPNAGFKATPFDIVENTKNLKFIELEAAQLARSLDDVHAAAVNTNYALQAGLNPLESLVREGPQSRYICEVVVRRQDIDKLWVKQLVAAFQAPNIKEFIDKRFKGAVIAGW
jgi:D-methionine transport system substrate-binding protein